MVRFRFVLAVLLALPALLPAAARACAPETAGMPIHLPAAGAGPRPLLLLLHGSTSRGSDILRDSGLVETADRHGFVLAAPDAGIRAGAGYAWNIPAVPLVTGALPAAADRDDVAFLLRTVDALARSGCVDRTRVYVTGLSGGGRMASWLACVAADRIAAIAPVVGLRAGRPRRDAPERPDAATCRPKLPMPVLAFAGDADTTNPIAGGGAPYWGYSMHAALQRWAALNRCTGAPATRWIAGGIYEEGYGGCRAGATVAARVAVGGSHAFAVADNEAMWAFLSRFSRP